MNVRAAAGERCVVGTVHEVGIDRTQLYVAVMTTLDAKPVLVGHRVVLCVHMHRRVAERCGQAQRRGLGAGRIVQVELDAGQQRLQRRAVHHSCQAIDHGIGDQILTRQRFECLAFNRRGAFGRDQLRVFQRQRDDVLRELVIVLDIALVLAVLDPVQRRLRNVDVAVLDQQRHLPIEQRQQQRADVRAVDVGVGHDDDAVIAQLVEVETIGVSGAPMPVPSAVINVAICSDEISLSKRAFSTFSTLPRNGSTAWNLRSRPCLAEPPAESPSTM